MGVMAPLLPPRPCRGPWFLFSLLLTWLIFRRKGPWGVMENRVSEAWPKGEHLSLSSTVG